MGGCFGKRHSPARQQQLPPQQQYQPPPSPHEEESVSATVPDDEQVAVMLQSLKAVADWSVDEDFDAEEKASRPMLSYMRVCRPLPTVTRQARAGRARQRDRQAQGGRPQEGGALLVC